MKHKPKVARRRKNRRALILALRRLAVTADNDLAVDDEGLDSEQPARAGYVRTHLGRLRDQLHRRADALEGKDAAE